MSATYDFGSIEPRWQQYWEDNHTFAADDDLQAPKYYVLDMFPYPSGAGLHVGHPEGYTASDIVARYMRMRGHNVLHPMGFDAFGLPAEQYAIEHGVHPRDTTQKNIDNMRRQIKRLGFSYDWSRELSTTDPEYYKWTQWIFIQLFNAWYDDDQQRARHIDELPIPAHITQAGPERVRRYRDSHRLAYLAEVPVNWCPALGTVLANEEVTSEGRSERGNHPVERRPLRQWMLRITAYAQRLLDDLGELDWPEHIKIMQRNWIGRSEGAEVDFPIVANPSFNAGIDQANGFAAWKAQRSRDGLPIQTPVDTIRVFTTRPDTLYGATYMVLAPEHPLVNIDGNQCIVPDRWPDGVPQSWKFEPSTDNTDKQWSPRQAVQAYQRHAAAKSELARTAESREKTGVFTGAYAINPVNGQPIPIWVADYVLMTYGTGAIMAVPAHDTRDFEFATAFSLDIIQVVAPGDGSDWQGYVGDGTNVNSPPPGTAGEDICDINGLSTPEAKKKISKFIDDRGMGKVAINYKLRDWLFSRQRYWGEPIPILHGENGELRAVDESELPVLLPEMSDFRPTGEPVPPLTKATDWVQVTIDGKQYRRETNTMPQWAGSCWYYLRYLDNTNDQRFVDQDKERYWMPIDLYIGGAEHAVLHLLYSRFWHKVLYDLGYVSTSEPYRKLFNQGMILGFAYKDARGAYVKLEDVEFRNETPYRTGTDEQLTEAVEKMSKSLGNVINPDDVVDQYGADTLRLYEMSMGPLDATKPWNTRDVSGVHRFLHRVWRLIVDADNGELCSLIQDVDADEQTLRLLHKTIKKVTVDMAEFGFNTAISQMIIFVNEMTSAKVRPRSAIEAFLKLLSPFAPHIAEELWHRLGHADTITYEPWPEYNDALTQDPELELAVQVNGKVRAKITVASDASEDDIREKALAEERIQSDLAGKDIKKVVVIKQRLVNIVAR